MSSKDRSLIVAHPAYSHDPSNEASDIFRAVGSAISFWARIEQELFAIYQNVSASDRMPVGASASFFAAHSIGTKLNMVTKLLEVTYFNETFSKLREDWKSVRNKIRETSKFRDQLAHGTLVKLAPEQHPNKRFIWVPFYNFATFTWALHDPQSGGLERHFALLSADDIDKRTQKFAKLHGYIVKFHQKYARDLVQPKVLPLRDLLTRPASAEQSDHHKTPQTESPRDDGSSRE